MDVSLFFAVVSACRMAVAVGVPHCLSYSVLLHVDTLLLHGIAFLLRLSLGAPYLIFE